MNAKTSTSIRARMAAASLLAAGVAGGVALAPGASASGYGDDFGAPGVSTALTYAAPNWNFDHEDNVQATYTPTGLNDRVQFVLHAAPNITWWKQIRVVNAAGKTLPGEIDYTQDAKHYTTVVTVTKSQLEFDQYVGLKLVFSKAKTFGIHTDMYQTKIQASDLGQRIVLDWLWD